jgi:hypothetical protein
VGWPYTLGRCRAAAGLGVLTPWPICRFVDRAHHYLPGNFAIQVQQYVLFCPSNSSVF